MRWKKRQEIPNIEVRDSADQFKGAWDILDKQPPGSGVVLPQMNAAAIAIELYLKCLCSELIHTPSSVMPEVSRVTAKPEQKGHILIQIFDKVAGEHQCAIQNLYAAQRPQDKRTFRELLKSLEGVFMASRYPFEEDSGIKKYKLSDLGFACAILHEYTANLEVTEIITW